MNGDAALILSITLLLIFFLDGPNGMDLQDALIQYLTTKG